MKGKILVNVTKFAVTFSILYFLVSRGRLNFEKLILLRQSSQLFLFLFLILVFWSLPITALRWWLLLQSIRLRLSFFRACILTWVGYFFSLILPGSVSGDVVKGYYVIKANKNKGKIDILMTLLIDRFIGLFGLIFLSVTGLLLSLKDFSGRPELKPFGLMIGGLFLGMVVFYILVLLPFKKVQDPFIKILGILPGHNFLLKLYRAFKLYQYEKQTLFITLLLSILNHAGNLFIIYNISHLFGTKNLDWRLLLFIIPLGFITTVIPLAPAGIGVGHAAFASLYNIMDNPNGADIFNLYIVLELMLFALGGIPYLMYSDYKDLRKK